MLRYVRKSFGVYAETNSMETAIAVLEGAMQENSDLSAQYLSDMAIITELELRKTKREQPRCF